MSGSSNLNLVKERIQSLSIGSPPAPWTNRGGGAIGGLTEVGFAPDSDMLLVVSSQGRGVFDCKSGELVARDRLADYSYHDGYNLVAEGIGPLKGMSVPLAGEAGGGLSIGTKDGWSIHDFVLDWPAHSIILCAEYSWPYDLTKSIWKISVDSEIRAFGFSPTGKSLVLATSSDLFFWGR
jgi:hypothetical protein